MFDETFKQRGNALRTYDAARKLGKSAPDFVEELVFDGTDAGLHADAVRRLFTETKVQDPALEVISTEMDNTAQLPTFKARKQSSVSNWPTGGEVVEFTVLDAGKFDDPQQGSSINTDVTTDVSSPEAAVDDVDPHSRSEPSPTPSDSKVVDSQSKSDQSLKVSDSEDLQDLNDGISIIDIMMRKEFDKTTFSTNPVADEGSGGATFTKRFQDDDEVFAFIRECEERLHDVHLLDRYAFHL